MNIEFIEPTFDVENNGIVTSDWQLLNIEPIAFTLVVVNSGTSIIAKQPLNIVDVDVNDVVVPS